MEDIKKKKRKKKKDGEVWLQKGNGFRRQSQVTVRWGIAQNSRVLLLPMLLVLLLLLLLLI